MPEGAAQWGWVNISPATTVRGLVINRFSAGCIGVWLSADNTWIAGNYIGIDPTGTVGEGNGGGIV